jgi:acetate kinase
MKPGNPRILTINGGSSSIKFALFEAGDSLRRILEGAIERIGLPEATLRVKGLNQADNFSRLVTAPDHTVAVSARMRPRSAPGFAMVWDSLESNSKKRETWRMIA